MLGESGASRAELDRSNDQETFWRALKRGAGRGIVGSTLVGDPLIRQRRNIYSVRGWHVRLVMAVISRVVTVLVGAALVLDVIMAMAMIVVLAGLSVFYVRRMLKEVQA